MGSSRSGPRAAAPPTHPRPDPAPGPREWPWARRANRAWPRRSCGRARRRARGPRVSRGRSRRRGRDGDRPERRRRRRSRWPPGSERRIRGADRPRPPAGPFRSIRSSSSFAIGGRSETEVARARLRRVSRRRARSPGSPPSRLPRPGGDAPRHGPSPPGRGEARPRERAGRESPGSAGTALQPIHQRRSGAGFSRPTATTTVSQRAVVSRWRAANRPERSAGVALPGAGKREKPLVHGARVRGSLRAPPPHPVTTGQPQRAAAQQPGLTAAQRVLALGEAGERDLGPRRIAQLELAAPEGEAASSVTSASGGSRETRPSGATRGRALFEPRRARRPSEPVPRPHTCCRDAARPATPRG